MKNNKILIVEDSKTISRVLQTKLEEFGYDLDLAYTLKEARVFLETNEYMAVLLDIHLPDGEGYELVDNINSTATTKIIVLTVSNEAQLREELFKYGIVDYIIKDKNFIYSIYEIHKTLQKLKMLSNKKILIIDDSSFVIKQVKIVLHPRNYIVYAAKSAKEGFDILQQEDIDLIVLDMELPDMHGLEVLEKIREDISLINVPIIVLSGTLDHDTIRKVLKGGGNDFIKKPFIVEEFVLKVDLLIENAQKEKMILQKAKKLNELNSSLEEKVSKSVEELREKDLMMLQQSRLAQTGEMLSMIAHQWKQPLNAIASTNATLKLKALMDEANNDVIMDATDKIALYIKHLSNTIDDFRDFFKPNKEMQESDFDTLVRSTLVIVKSSLDNKNIKVLTELNSHTKFISYTNELKQVILNFIKNAEDAIVEREIENASITIRTYENDDELILEVLDNAGGIPQDIISRIFDPYFSTKTKKDGVGLGLYMSKIIVKDHCSGKLEVKNYQDGALFKIILKKNSNIK
ncbi:PUTATIVE TWO-COMPONENT SENSOR [hydrothermal vent metagenome]|uniref:PUTATIVE TWO-COMPONENT SENSOR n=1 Tax=hydrothermal vent metagenome TaxID=652676 RepID=A0A1W1BEB2_9ZZZZ